MVKNLQLFFYFYISLPHLSGFGFCLRGENLSTVDPSPLSSLVSQFSSLSYHIRNELKLDTVPQVSSLSTLDLE